MKRKSKARTIFATISIGLFLSSQAIFYIVVISSVLLSFLNLAQTGALVFETVVGAATVALIAALFHFAYRSEADRESY